MHAGRRAARAVIVSLQAGRRSVLAVVVSMHARRRATLALLAFLGAAAGGQQAVLGQEALLRGSEAVRFAVVDVYVESERPLAAWQFELAENAGQMQVVGIEGGDAEAFDDPPYYDRDAVEAGTAERIVVASFSMSPPSGLPVGRTRVATVHVRLAGPSPADYELNLVAAGGADGNSIDARISFDTR